MCVPVLVQWPNNRHQQAFEMDDLIIRRNAEDKAKQLRLPGWRLYTMISLLFFLALCAAVQWYHYLDGRAVNPVPVDQSWAIRVGTLSHFCSRALLRIAGSNENPLFIYLDRDRYPNRRHTIKSKTSGDRKNKGT